MTCGDTFGTVSPPMAKRAAKAKKSTAKRTDSAASVTSEMAYLGIRLPQDLLVEIDEYGSTLSSDRVLSRSQVARILMRKGLDAVGEEA